MLLEILRLVHTSLDLLGKLSEPIRIMIVQPMVTVAILLILYAGWHIRDEGSIAAGLRVAFIDTRAYETQHLQGLEVTILQNALHQSAATDKLIDQFLTTLLQRSPLAARVRLAVLHNGSVGLTGTALMRYDVINGVASIGHSVGALAGNQPLSDLNSFLPALLAGNCEVHQADAGGNVAVQARLRELGAGTLMTCPVIDIQQRLIGAVSITWDGDDAAPHGDELRSLTTFAHSVCAQIAAALDLRNHVANLDTPNKAD